MAVVIGLLTYSGGRLSGWKEDLDEDEYDRKEKLMKLRRRPIEETIRDVGEGRGLILQLTLASLMKGLLTFLLNLPPP